MTDDTPEERIVQGVRFAFTETRQSWEAAALAYPVSVERDQPGQSRYLVFRPGHVPRTFTEFDKAAAHAIEVKRIDVIAARKMVAEYDAALLSGRAALRDDEEPDPNLEPARVSGKVWRPFDA